MKYPFFRWNKISTVGAADHIEHLSPFARGTNMGTIQLIYSAKNATTKIKIPMWEAGFVVCLLNV